MLKYLLPGLLLMVTQSLFSQSEAPNIGGDRILCQGDSLILDGGEFESYLWSTGDTTRTLVVSTPGEYTLLVFNGGNSYSASIRITAAADLSGRIPNVFTPNGDGRNDVFIPVPELPATGNYSLQIFNRSGVEVFHSAQPAIGWNGKTDLGENFPEGSYFAVVVFDTVCGSEKTSGPLTLLR